MKNFALPALGLAATIGVLASCASDGDKAAKPAQAAATTAQTPLTIERSADVSVTAKVKAIDYTTREVKLEDASGHAISIIAGPQVKRLNEVKVGDTVAADYAVSLIAELRPPTAEESASPIAAVAVAGRSTQASDPAGGAAQGVRIVTTVAAVDLPNMLVTLRGPMGDTTVVRGRNPENVKKLRVGDTIVITYVEALAVSLVKASKP